MGNRQLQEVYVDTHDQLVAKLHQVDYLQSENSWLHALNSSLQMTGRVNDELLAAKDRVIGVLIIALVIALLSVVFRDGGPETEPA